MKAGEHVAVSVIVPVYNVAQYLNKCLESIKSQTLGDMQIILVNDGSTDSSGEVCQAFAALDPRMTVITQQNAGLAAARQAGLDIATGEYIGFVDSDDWLELNMYEKMYEAARLSGADIVFCNGYRDEAKKEVPCLNSGFYDHARMEKEIFPRLLASFDVCKRENNIRWCNWLRIYRKELIDKHKIAFDKRFRRCQDLPFTFECTIHAGSYYYLGDEYLYHNRMNYESLSKGYTKNMWELIKPLAAYLWDKVAEYAPYNFRDQMRLRSFLFAVACAENEVLPNNRRNLLNRIRTILEIASDEMTRRTLDGIPVKILNKRLQLYYYCLKYKFPAGLYVLACQRYGAMRSDYYKRRKI